MTYLYLGELSWPSAGYEFFISYTFGNHLANMASPTVAGERPIFTGELQEQVELITPRIAAKLGIQISKKKKGKKAQVMKSCFRRWGWNPYDFHDFQRSVEVLHRPQTYCWWFRNPIPNHWLDVQDLVNNGMNYLWTGAGFLSSTVFLQLLTDLPSECGVKWVKMFLPNVFFLE